MQGRDAAADQDSPHGAGVGERPRAEQYDWPPGGPERRGERRQIVAGNCCPRVGPVKQGTVRGGDVRRPGAGRGEAAVSGPGAMLAGIDVENDRARRPGGRQRDGVAGYLAGLAGADRDGGFRG